MNFSSGRYFGGKNNETASRLPFDAGFEVYCTLRSLQEMLLY